MTGVARISISLPPELLKEFDELVKKLGFERSQAVQRAMRNFITDYRWLEKAEGDVAGAIVVVYSHEKHGVEEELTDIQHHYLEYVKSALHIHLDEEHCMLIIAVKGPASEVRTLAEKLLSTEGVLQSRVTVISVKG